jgi:hypothetical protein
MEFQATFEETEILKFLLKKSAEKIFFSKDEFLPQIKNSAAQKAFDGCMKKEFVRISGGKIFVTQKGMNAI